MKMPYHFHLVRRLVFAHLGPVFPGCPVCNLLVVLGLAACIRVHLGPCLLVG